MLKLDLLTGILIYHIEEQFIITLQHSFLLHPLYQGHRLEISFHSLVRLFLCYLLEIIMPGLSTCILCADRTLNAGNTQEGPLGKN